MKNQFSLSSLLVVALFLYVCGSAQAWMPVPVKEDPLVRMPGSQPPTENSITLQGPTSCGHCHGGYNTTVEPSYNWKGSMMAQAARDFLFWSCMTVSAQDSIWATGRPNATDICLRCHFPQGWVEGRSDPTNATLMRGDDYSGVHCDICHTSFDPFFEATKNGIREGGDWPNYWDETNVSATPSNTAATLTYDKDMIASNQIFRFTGLPFYTAFSEPFSTSYTENASGQMYLTGTSDKRASFADANAPHNILYSRYNKSKYMCATCHDVSNPVLANLGADPEQPLPTEVNSAFSYYHVERTFSEFMLSAYGQQGGATGIGPFAPEVFKTSLPGNAIARCQDCHMKDGTGKASFIEASVLRPTNSTEHPASGQPVHDMTGGNAWVSYVLASAVTGSPNYDSVNAQLLKQGPSVLTLDLTQGLPIDPAALIAGANRAKQQLQMAASIQNAAYVPVTGVLSFRIQNQTGHKLISGFPEGRRMFVNIKLYDSSNSIIFEVNPYDYSIGTLKGLPQSYSPSSPPVDTDEVYNDNIVYETHPKSDVTGEDETFHFALATGRYKDNRIPPKGFRINEAAARLSVSVDHGVDAPNMYTAAEYAGGYDDVSLTLPAGAASAKIELYYQTTSREYIEFLRDEINGTGNPTLSSPTPSGEPEAYVIQSDPFFAKLKAWGNTIWQLWTRNMNVDGAKPFLMTSATAAITQPATTTTTQASTSTTTVPSVIDTDSDGVADGADNCEYRYNPLQLDGDGDSIGDVCDPVPGCGGCGQAACEQYADSDNDGISDVIDNCPTICNSQQFDADNDGVGDVCDTTPGCGGCGQIACEAVCTLQ